MPASLYHLNFYKDSNVRLGHNSEFIINKTREVHGLVGYFKAGLSEKVILSTSPEEPITHLKTGISWWWKTAIYLKNIKIAQFNQSNFSLKKNFLVILQSLTCNDRVVRKPDHS